MSLETKLLYLIMAGWALMIFVPSFVPALFMAAGLGIAAAYIVFLGAGDAVQLKDMVIAIAPSVAGAVFIAWPVGMVFRWVLRRKRAI